MSSPASNCNSSSSSFELLDDRIQHWIWELGWSELRDVQEKAIPAILDKKDVIIAAATASGKTEAAFFPILTRLLAAKNEKLPVVIYISPLKALINDQWSRLELLCETLNVMVTPWHGDVSLSKKKRFIRQTSGCLLITPESLEALFMNYGHQINSIFSSLAYVVVDEVHAFMGTERGKQLQSLLHRLDIVLKQKTPRIGLSATLGDMKLAADFLRPEQPEGVAIICSKSDLQELKVLAIGYRIEERHSAGTESIKTDDIEDELSLSFEWVASKLFSSLRGANNLVFPNSRVAVEIYSDKLRKMCEARGFPNEFWPHHGSLSKEIREDAEQALKKKERPATAICTNTLELGIDIGSVKSVAQIGPPPSVASLRQRLGRSGRKRGEPAILRAYCIEDSINQHSKIPDLLREQLIQTVAMIRLLIQGWCEPIGNKGLHLSTLVQQLLSGITQYGGLTASQAWKIFCENGPFSNLSKQGFLSLLQSLGQQDVIMQDHTGLLILGKLGEKFVNHYSFYAAFQSDEEYRIICQGRPLGSLPISKAIMIGSYLIFAGRRWRVESVEEQQKTIVVQPDKGGRAPLFFGGGAKVHNKVREEMQTVLSISDEIPFLDKTGVELLQEARFNYAQMRLAQNPMMKAGKDVNLFIWKGDNVQDTLSLMFVAHGTPATNEGLYISVEAKSIELVYSQLTNISENPEMAAEKLAEYVENKKQEKWDWLLADELLNQNYASLNLDVKETMRVIKKIISKTIRTG